MTTGRVTDRGEIAALAREAAKMDGRVCIDTGRVSGRRPRARLFEDPDGVYVLCGRRASRRRGRLVAAIVHCRDPLVVSFERDG